MHATEQLAQLSPLLRKGQRYWLPSGTVVEVAGLDCDLGGWVAECVYVRGMRREPEGGVSIVVRGRVALSQGFLLGYGKPTV